MGTRLGGGMRVASTRAARQVAQHSWRRGPHESTVQPSTRSPHSHCDPTERINTPSLNGFLVQYVSQRIHSDVS